MEISGFILKKSLREYGITQDKAAEFLGVSRQTLNTWCSKSSLTPHIIGLVKGKLGIDLTSSDLTVLNELGPTYGLSTPRLEAIPLRLADPYGFEATGQKFYTLADGSDVMQIPVVPQGAWGSYPRGHADPEFYEGFENITVPVNNLHKGMYMAFEMKGRSMVNIETEEMARKSLWPGQKIIGRDLRREQWQYKLHIHSNDAWIVVHKDDGITVKEILDHNLETGIIKLHAWNPDKNEYPDFEWHIDDIQQIFNVVDPFAKMRPY